MKKIKKTLTKQLTKLAKMTLSLKTRIKILNFRKRWKTFPLFQNTLIPGKLDRERAKEFAYYLFSNDISEKEKLLINNLDEASKKEIFRFLKRQDLIYTHNLINLEKEFSPEEKAEQDVFSKEDRLSKRKLKKYNFHNLPESLIALNGLRYLSSEITNTIKGTTILDIGAYIGDSAVSFLRFQPDKIYSFEPEKYNYKKLEKTIALSDSDIIIPIKKGVSNQTKKTHISNKGIMSEINTNKEGEEIELTTIDDFVSSNKIKKVGLIKMDIEGEEANALLGAKATIERDLPILAISIYHKPEDLFEIKPWLETNFPNYNFIVKKTNPFSLNCELMLLAYTK